MARGVFTSVIDFPRLFLNVYIVQVADMTGAWLRPESIAPVSL